MPVKKKITFSIYYLEELKYRIAYILFSTAIFFSITYAYKQELIFVLLPKGLSHFVTTGLTEIFFTYLQLCTNLTVNFAITITLIQLLFFFLPGLYKYEANICLRILVLTIVCNIVLYIFIFPIFIQIFWKIFYAYSVNFMPIHLTYEPKFNDYVQHLKQFNTLLTFILPCIIAINLMQKYTRTSIWVKYRGLIYIGAFTFAAFMTPPDIISQILVGVPLIFLYEIQILYKIIKDRYKTKLLIRQPIKPHKDTNRKN